MYARVTHYRILPGKIDEFTGAVDSLMPAAQKVKGFRFVLALRGDATHREEATTVSVWDSLEDLHASDNNVFYYQVIARLLSCCESFPVMHEQEVLLSEFAAR